MLGRILICLFVVSVTAATAAAQSNDLVFAVTEGVTYQATPKEIRDKFTPLAEMLGKAAGRRVRIVLVPAYDDLRAGLAKQEYDVAFVHPGARLDGRDQGRPLLGDRVDERLHRVHRLAADATRTGRSSR